MLITLLTDFGTADYFVAAMKGVILARQPGATLVDITHEIPPQDIHAGAFTLLAVYEAFPAGTVHLAVVDPGVGSARRPLALAAGGQLFVGPDNGLFSYILDREPDASAFHVTNERVFRTPVSATFHGRDIFAPAAAALAGSAPLDELGEEISDPVRLEPLRPRRMEDGTLQGAIIHLDRFGNCITSLTRAELPEEVLAPGARLYVGAREIRSVRRFFAAEGTEEGEPFAIWGSAGFLEIAAFRDSAAWLLGVGRGEPVMVTIGAPR